MGEQGRPSRSQTTARKKRTKEDKKFVINYYLKARKEGQRGYRKRMRQYWIQEVMIEVTIKTFPVEGFDVTSIIEIGVEQNHLTANGGTEKTNELAQTDDTHRIKRMIVVILYLH